MHCHGSMRVHAALSAAQAGPIGRCLLCCCCVGCHGALRPLRHPLLLPSHLRPWRNQSSGRAEGPAGQLLLGRIVVVHVLDEPERRGRRVNEKCGHHHHAPWKSELVRVIRGHEEGRYRVDTFRGGPPRSESALGRSQQPQRFKSEFRRIFGSMRLRTKANKGIACGRSAWAYRERMGHLFPRLWPLT